MVKSSLDWGSSEYHDVSIVFCSRPPLHFHFWIVAFQISRGIIMINRWIFGGLLFWDQATRKNSLGAPLCAPFCGRMKRWTGSCGYIANTCWPQTKAIHKKHKKSIQTHEIALDSIWRRFFLTVTTCYDLTCPNFSNTPSLNAHNGGADEPISGLAIVSKPASVGNRMTRTSIHDTIFVSSPGVVCRLGNPAGAMMKWPSWYPQTLDILGLYCPVVPGEKEDLRRILPRLFNHAGVSLQDIDSVCEEVENLMGDNAGENLRSLGFDFKDCVGALLILFMGIYVDEWWWM